MIKLSRIVEQQGMEGQFYDLGRDFANFRRVMDGTTEQVKQKFEQAIGARLNGKRIRARASRGYKQYVKDYEFDVANVTLDDYYDNYVVVAHDNATPKSKEYFLKAGFKIQILGPASGQPSPQNDEKSKEAAPKPITPKENPDKAQSQPMTPAPPGTVPYEETPIKEEEKGYEAYPIESIEEDIKGWIGSILKIKIGAFRDFIKKIGWMKQLGHGKSIAVFEVRVPMEAINENIKKVSSIISKAGASSGKIRIFYQLLEMKKDETKEDIVLRIKKTTTDTSQL